MKSLKTLAVLAVAAGISSLAFAQAAPPGRSLASPDFAQHKQQELARIGMRMQALQTLQGCIQAAANHAAIKACNETARASMKDRAG